MGVWGGGRARSWAPGRLPACRPSAPLPSPRPPGRGGPGPRDASDLHVLAAAVDGTLVAAVDAREPGGFVTGVTLRAAESGPGDLFAALPGARVHGADFVGQARSAGAAAILTDPTGLERARAGGVP